mmetsp:Transcript_3435/g.7555  ORF Transcript_3435/g.7555 Transcript_3435/m.7555 type:complete len:362 (-) Transcript_3435:380-1465(-)
MLLPKKKQRLMLIPSWPSHGRRVRARPRASVHRCLRRRLRIGDPLSFRDNLRRLLRSRCGCRRLLLRLLNRCRGCRHRGKRRLVLHHGRRRIHRRRGSHRVRHARRRSRSLEEMLGVPAQLLRNDVQAKVEKLEQVQLELVHLLRGDASDTGVVRVVVEGVVEKLGSDHDRRHEQAVHVVPRERQCSGDGPTPRGTVEVRECRDEADGAGVRVPVYALEVAEDGYGWRPRGVKDGECRFWTSRIGTRVGECCFRRDDERLERACEQRDDTGQSGVVQELVPSCGEVLGRVVVEVVLVLVVCCLVVRLAILATARGGSSRRGGGGIVVVGSRSSRIIILLLLLLVVFFWCCCWCVRRGLRWW